VKLPCLFLALTLAAAQDQDPQKEPVYKFGTTVVVPAGLRGTIFYIRDGTEWLPDFRKLKPVGTIYTTSLNVPPQMFDVGFPGVTKRFEWFAIEYTGRFWIATPGLYRFSLLSDDGSKLFIDDDLVIENDGVHAPREQAGGINLAGGIHRIRVLYFQGPRLNVALVLRVARPGELFRIFNTDEFKPPPDADIPPEPPEEPGKKGRKKRSENRESLPQASTRTAREVTTTSMPKPPSVARASITSPAGSDAPAESRIRITDTQIAHE
jgi:hypothetical protein